MDGQFQTGDTLVVASIDRIGRRWLDTVDNIRTLQGRGVRIRSLPESEASWSRYLDADPDSTEDFIGNALATFAAVVDHAARGISQRQLGRISGCSASTIRRTLAAWTACNQLPESPRQIVPPS